MPKGGAREGAGRKKGVPNKASAAREAEVRASGLTPLDYMLSVLRDPSVEYERRDKMAVAVAPYVHPKLSTTEVTGKDGAALVSDREPRDIARLILALLRKAASAPSAPDEPNSERPGGSGTPAEVAGTDSIN